MEPRLRNYVEDLKFLTGVDSGSFNPEGIEQVNRFFELRLGMNGWFHQRVKHNPLVGDSLLISNFQYRSGDEIDLLLVGHSDTIFPNGTAKEWPLTVDENKISAPGIADIKSGLLSCMYVLQHLDFRGYRRKPRIVFLINSHEEFSSHFNEAWLKEIAKESKYALVLSPSNRNGELYHERRGVAKFEVTFNGKAAHTGIEPERGINTIEELAKWILELHSMSDLENGLSVNVGVVNGGIHPSTIAPKTVAQVDVRFNNQEGYEKVQSRLEEMVENPFTKGIEVSLDRKGFRPVMTSTEESRELMAEIETIAERLNIPKVKFARSKSSSDANFIAEIGVTTLDGFGPIGTHTHSRDEFIEVDSIIPRMLLLEESIKLILSKLGY